MGGRMMTGGHLCIDLGDIQMTGNDQQELMKIVQTTVVGFLVKLSQNYKVVTVSMSENNGNFTATKPAASTPPATTPPAEDGG